MRNGGSDCAGILTSFVSRGYFLILRLFLLLTALILLPAFSGGDLRETCASLDGVFAFVMCDANYVYLGRDPIGVRPLFYGFASNGNRLQ